MNVLYICTSAQDRSVALVEYFSIAYPQHNYRCAGINKYFTKKKGTHYLTQEDWTWANLIVFCEEIHKTVACSMGLIGATSSFKDGKYDRCQTVLACGEYAQGCIGDDYLQKADLKLKSFLET